jgi:hypothetical protein
MTSLQSSTQAINATPNADVKPGECGAIFPREFIFDKRIFEDMTIKASPVSPTLYCISTHKAFSSKPSVILHNGMYEKCPPLATAQLHSFSDTDIRLFGMSLALQRKSGFSKGAVFNFPMGNGSRELFEWKRSSGSEVSSLGGSSWRHGMKLVSSKTGEVVAAWAPHSMSKHGKMRFTGLLGDTFEVMAVITLLAILEKARRSNRGAASGAAGGATGGGGC